MQQQTDLWFSLAGRVVLVVGAGMVRRVEDDPVGNGKAIAHLCAQGGASVVCADLSAEAAKETASEIEAAGGTAMAVQADIADPEDCERLVHTAIDSFGRVDGIVLNVGIAAGIGLDTGPEEWDQVMRVNARGHYLVLRAAFPHLPPGSAVVLIGSLAGYIPGSGVPAYDASKAALEGICRFFAHLGSSRDIRVNIVAPGFIDTSLGRFASSLRPDRERTPIPMGRQGTSREVAFPTVFLLSDGASYITAQTIFVDGGLGRMHG